MFDLLDIFVAIKVIKNQNQTFLLKCFKNWLKDHFHFRVFLTQEEYHDNDIEPWVAENQDEYMSLTYKGPKSSITPDDARTLGMQQCKTIYCDYYLSVDAEVSLTNPKTLQLLIEQNR